MTDSLIADIFRLFEEIYNVKCPWSVVQFKSDSQLKDIIEDLVVEKAERSM